MYHTFVTVQDKKVYVAGGSSPIDDALWQVYVYDVNTDLWSRLPLSGHYCGIPQIIGGKLAIIGGAYRTIDNRTNKVSTFDESSQKWTFYYPNLQSVRYKPGVVTRLEHVIVAGGGLDDTTIAQDDIEVLNWIENSHWRKASIRLPVPLRAFSPIITDGQLVIVGYTGADSFAKNHSLKIPIDNVIRSSYEQHTSAQWLTMTSATHWFTAAVPNSSPPVVVGGTDQNAIPTSEIKIYNEFSKSWRQIACLSSPRTRTAVAAVNDNAIMVIGGCTEANNVDNCKSSSLTTVELGQTQLIR